MIVLVGGVKGGSGKTTIATNLTVLRANENKKVLLVDADEQKSVSDWAEQRENLGIKTNWSTIQLSGKSVYAQLERMKCDYDDIIIDAGGRDTTSQRAGLLIADIYLIPFKPRSLDIWTLGCVKNLISEIKIGNSKLKCIAIINQADSKGSDNDDAKEVIAKSDDIKCLDFSIGHRKAFANAASDGLSVIEMKNQDKKAIQEIEMLYGHIYNQYI